jgi:hypothetical protein
VNKPRPALQVGVFLWENKMQTKFEQLLDKLSECKAALGVITPDWLSGLNDNELEYVVTTFNKWFDSVQSAANYLAVLRNERLCDRVIQLRPRRRLLKLPGFDGVQDSCPACGGRFPWCEACAATLEDAR